MNIWFIRHYNLINERPHHWGRELVKRGHQVTLFASSFNLHTLKEEHLRHGENCKIEDIDGVRFIWLRGMPYKKNDWRRYLGTIEFTLRAIFVGLMLRDKPDVIVGTVVHPFAPLAAYVLSKIKKCRFNYEANDIWPQVLVEEGILSEKSLTIRFLRWLEHFLMIRSNRIQSILPHVDKYLEDIGIPPSKFVWVPNPVLPDLFSKIEPYQGSSDGKFIVMFITTFSPHPIDFDTILEAAQIFQNEKNDNVSIVFVGDGISRTHVESKSTEMGLKNVKFTGWIDKSKLQIIMKDAAVFLVMAKPYRIHRYGIAFNKLYTGFMGKRPIILTSFDADNPVEVSQAGITISDGDPHALVDAIKRLMSMSYEQIAKLGMNGYNYAIKVHNIESSTDRLLTALENYRLSDESTK